ELGDLAGAAGAAVHRHVVTKAARSESALDLAAFQVPHTGAESITDGAAEQSAAEPLGPRQLGRAGTALLTVRHRRCSPHQAGYRFAQAGRAGGWGLGPASTSPAGFPVTSRSSS